MYKPSFGFSSHFVLNENEGYIPILAIKHFENDDPINLRTYGEPIINVSKNILCLKSCISMT